jgi:glycine/D-amino acid oxidase-like deaminating enzyme
MSYDAVIIGAGISGAANAYHLRRAGAKMLLLERGEAASGDTGKSAAIIRQSYSKAPLSDSFSCTSAGDQRGRTHLRGASGPAKSKTLTRCTFFAG